MLNRMGIVAFFILAAAVWTAPVSAQIVNTLRGFQDDEMGWSGGVEGEMAIADGNTDYLEFEVSGAIQRQNERTRWRLLGRSLRRTASGEEVAESRMAHLRHNYRLTSKLSSVIFTQAQYEPFRHVESRLLAGAGARVDLPLAGWHAAVGAAVMIENEKSSGEFSRTKNDVRGSFFVTMFRGMANGVNIDFVGFYQPRVDDLGDARAVVSASLRADIIGALHSVLRYNAEFDTDPEAGVDKLDQNMRAGLGLDI